MNYAAYNLRRPRGWMGPKSGRLLWLGLLLLWGAPAAADPDVVECLGAVVPSAQGCQGTNYTGCCDVFGRVFWCEGNDLYCIDCASTFPACGWHPLGYYDCGQPSGSEDPTGQAPAACGACPVECAPGAACSATCGGGCGTCEEEGAVCLPEGSCYVPQCDGKACGEDPLGFSCGVCPSGTECVDGLFQCLPLPEPCLPRATPGCGEGCGCEPCVCEAYPTCCTEAWDVFCASACELECGFDCSACPPQPSCDDIECGEYCGVSCGGCSDEQVCVAYQCCTPSCDGKECGSDGCGGTCGTCGAGEECAGGQCIDCQPKCAGKVCGDDGCGGVCGECAAGEFCLDGDCSTTPCSKACGDFDVSCGDGCQCSCSESCFVAGDCCPGICDACEDFGGCCVPQCDGKSCGADGCGGTCGACEVGSRCAEGVCEICEDPCAGKECGPDGCGGDCGGCGFGFKCTEGICEVCESQCAGKECGPDGCDGVCGDCELGQACVSGICVGTVCTPSCDGKECGPDGCGGFCGSCAGASQCINFQCQGLADPCMGITALGCCNGPVNQWCEGLGLKQKDCGDVGLTCGWNDLYGYYDCTEEPVGDPFGVFPYDCAALCSPYCGDRVCGDDGCSGSCGTCGAGTACEAGQCVDAPEAEAEPDAAIADSGDSASGAEDEGTGGSGGGSSGGCRTASWAQSGSWGWWLVGFWAWRRRRSLSPCDSRS